MKAQGKKKSITIGSKEMVATDGGGQTQSSK
jgi:hypothetical protein